MINNKRFDLVRYAVRLVFQTRIQQKQEISKNSKQSWLQITTYKLFSVFEVFTAVSVGIELRKKALRFVCNKMDAKQHKLATKLLLKTP